ncbi:hypothetical protein V8E51_003034 [Hyaloscypha variabilis]
MAFPSQETKPTPSNNGQSLVSSQDKMSQPLDIFHPFPKLPLEIREMIWELALPDGRRILRPDIVVAYDKPIASTTEPQSLGLGNKVCVARFHFSKMENNVIHTLQTYYEAHRVTLKRFPFRLPDTSKKEEIRFGADDILELCLEKWVRSRRDDLLKALSMFRGLKTILLIEDYNDVTIACTNDRYPADFVEFPNGHDQVAPFKRDSLSEIWMLAQKLKRVLAESGSYSDAQNIPKVKVMYQEHARLDEIARRGAGTGDAWRGQNWPF